MGRIHKKQRECGEGKIGDGTVQRRLYMYDFVLHYSTRNGLQHALKKFLGARCVVGIKIDTTNTETMSLLRTQRSDLSKLIEHCWKSRKNLSSFQSFSQVTNELAICALKKLV